LKFITLCAFVMEAFCTRPRGQTIMNRTIYGRWSADPGSTASVPYDNSRNSSTESPERPMSFRSVSLSDMLEV